MRFRSALLERFEQYQRVQKPRSGIRHAGLDIGETIFDQRCRDPSPRVSAVQFQVGFRAQCTESSLRCPDG